jgi:hypothetical protein
VPTNTATLTEFISGAAGVVVVLSGIFAGIARAYAVITGATPDEIERATAVGFVVGTVLAVALLVGELAS